MKPIAVIGTYFSTRHKAEKFIRQREKRSEYKYIMIEAPNLILKGYIVINRNYI